MNEHRHPNVTNALVLNPSPRILWRGATLKKWFMIAIYIMMTTALVACGQTGEQATSSEPAANQTRAREITAERQLLVGILRLEETDLAITRQQAEELLPLLKAHRSLLESDAAAQAEIEALVSQMQEVFTAEQRQAIAEMDTSQESLAEMMGELGLRPQDMVPERASGEGTLSRRGLEGGAPPQGLGQPPGEFFGGGPGQGEGMSPEVIATLQTRRAEGGGRLDRAGLFLLSPVIELLEAKL